MCANVSAVFSKEYNCSPVVLQTVVLVFKSMRIVCRFRLWQVHPFKVCECVCAQSKTYPYQSDIYPVVSRNGWSQDLMYLPMVSGKSQGRGTECLCSASHPPTAFCVCNIESDAVVS